MAETVKCAAGLIELRNAIRRELQGEIDGASRYREAAAKFTHFGHQKKASALKLIAEDELLHHAVLDSIVEDITRECEE